MRFLPSRQSALRRVLTCLVFAFSLAPSFSLPSNPYLNHTETLSLVPRQPITEKDTLVLYPIEDEANPGFNKHDYSRFKYGDVTFANQYGREMAKLAWQELVKPILDEDRADNKPLARFASMLSRGSLPTAATTFESYFCQYLNRYLAEAGAYAVLSLPILKATSASRSEDYATMSDEDREKFMNDEHFTFDKEAVKDMVVFNLDDIYITGGHERAIRRTFKQESDAGRHNDVYYLYIAKLVNTSIDPAIETRLNEVAVPQFSDLKAIIEGPMFVIENRFVKRMLKASRSDLEALIDSLNDGKAFAKKLYDAALKNDFHMGGNAYKANLKLVKKKAGL
ncbi:PRTase ComF-like protein [Colletotrichum cereale]|nr:PRTase ComF-like protein [Colletotrichum cereale]